MTLLDPKAAQYKRERDVLSEALDREQVVRRKREDERDAFSEALRSMQAQRDELIRQIGEERDGD